MSIINLHLQDKKQIISTNLKKGIIQQYVFYIDEFCEFKEKNLINPFKINIEFISDIKIENFFVYFNKKFHSMRVIIVYDINNLNFDTGIEIIDSYEYIIAKQLTSHLNNKYIKNDGYPIFYQDDDMDGNYLYHNHCFNITDKDSVKVYWSEYYHNRPLKEIVSCLDLDCYIITTNLYYTFFSKFYMLLLDYKISYNSLINMQKKFNKLIINHIIYKNEFYTEAVKKIDKLFKIHRAEELKSLFNKSEKLIEKKVSLMEESFEKNRDYKLNIILAFITVFGFLSISEDSKKIIKNIFELEHINSHIYYTTFFIIFIIFSGFIVYYSFIKKNND